MLHFPRQQNIELPPVLGHSLPHSIYLVPLDQLQSGVRTLFKEDVFWVSVGNIQCGWSRDSTWSRLVWWEMVVAMSGVNVAVRLSRQMRQFFLTCMAGYQGVSIYHVPNCTFYSIIVQGCIPIMLQGSLIIILLGVSLSGSQGSLSTTYSNDVSLSCSKDVSLSWSKDISVYRIPRRSPYYGPKNVSLSCSKEYTP